jgi:gliding motility-associated protein GldL
MAGVSRRTEIIVNVIVCVGAAIVIFGAWAKILHKPFADFMLTVGLLTEAFIFFVYAFIPPPPSYAPEPVKKSGGNDALNSIDKMLQEADITPTNLQKLSSGFSKLGTTVEKMGEIGDVVKSTGDFSANASSAAAALSQVRQTLDRTVGSMSEFNEASESTKQFHNQVQSLTKNMASLNTIYELELQDTSNHLKAMNKFFGNLVSVSDTMGSSIEDARQAQMQINQLASNLSKLNSVYGNMLTAMQGRA